MNIRELLNGSHNSEDGSVDEKAGKKRDSDLPEPVEWTDSNLQKIVNALVIRGYGNWDGISKESKLNWSDYDIARGARLALLQLLKWSCMALPANQSASTTNTTDSEPASDTPLAQSQGQSQSQSQISSTSNDQAVDAVYEFAPDNKYLTVFLRKSRACWMAVACQNREPVDMTDQTTRIDTEPEGDKSLAEDRLLENALETYQSQRSSLLVIDDGVALNSECGGSKADVDRDSLKSYYEAYDRLCCWTLEPSASDASTQEQRPEDSNMDVEGDQEAISVPAPVKYLAPALTAEAVVTVLSCLELPSAFADVPLDRVLKTRTAARAKLSQIEDLFELHLLAQLLEPTAAPAMLASDNMAIVEEVNTDQVPTTTRVPMDSATGYSMVGISSVLSPLSLDQWTCEEDARLIRLVDKVCGQYP